jgi:hypothetical protein
MRADIRLILLFAGAAFVSSAQWVSYPTPGIPRTPDGKPNLTEPAPHASDGKPDLSGLWQVEPTPWAQMKPLVGNLNDLFAPGDDLREFSKYAINILADFRPEDAPLRPEAAAVLRQSRASANVCLPQGLPFVYLIPTPAKWIQTPGLIAIALEGPANLRQIYTDGRKLPTSAQPMWQGYSVGHWEGDTLVVDSMGFNDQTRLDAMGHPHSDALHEIERYHRRDFGHMDVAVTIDDPKMYTRPFTIKYTKMLLADTDLLEYVCEEDEKDLSHMPRK